MKKKFGLGYFSSHSNIIDIKLDLHVYYVFLIIIVKNNFSSITDTRGTHYTIYSKIELS